MVQVCDSHTVLFSDGKDWTLARELRQVEAERYGRFKRALRKAVRLLEDELSQVQDPKRSQALASVRRELAALNAARPRPASVSGYPGPRQLRSHRIVVDWPEDDPVKQAVLEVEAIYLDRLP